MTLAIRGPLATERRQGTLAVQFARSMLLVKPMVDEPGQYVPKQLPPVKLGDGIVQPP